MSDEVKAMDKILSLLIIAAESKGPRGMVDQGCAQVDAGTLRQLRALLRERTPSGEPERLWCEANIWPLDVWPPRDDGETPPESGVEYVRADLHAAEIARLERELSEARERERRLCRALGDLIGLAEAAMREADDCGGEYDVDGELSDARALLAEVEPPHPDLYDGEGEG